MLIDLTLVIGVVALILSAVSTILVIRLYIDVQAMKLSTHTVIPMAPDSAISKLETHLNEVAGKAGANQADLNRGFHDIGLDPEELV